MSRLVGIAIVLVILLLLWANPDWILLRGLDDILLQTLCHLQDCGKERALVSPDETESRAGFTDSMQNAAR